ncbi:MAG TPA: hypothetical protein VFR93_10175 [Candidatus Limnocylindrales bacterium]|nr:hypothetical protein [Candidatus Limnocylindrales bacterium]
MEPHEPQGRPEPSATGGDASLPRPLERLRYRLPVIASLAAIGVLYLLVSERLTLGPSWLPLATVAVLILVAIVELTQEPNPAAIRVATLVVTSALTLAIAASTVLLVGILVTGGLPGIALLQGAGIIWVANLLTFAVWYWEIDGGGPLERRRTGPGPADFLFPQYTISHASARRAARRQTKPWTPEFVDYFFLAFNTSSAFSPTDTLTLSRRAKILMMIQSTISLLTVAVLAARAINILR